MLAVLRYFLGKGLGARTENDTARVWVWHIALKMTFGNTTDGPQPTFIRLLNYEVQCQFLTPYKPVEFLQEKEVVLN